MWCLDPLEDASQDTLLDVRWQKNCLKQLAELVPCDNMRTESFKPFTWLLSKETWQLV